MSATIWKVRLEWYVNFTWHLTFLTGPLPDPHIIASVEKLRDKRPQPGISKLLHGLEALNFVDSKFGPVPFGSLLSYPGAPGFPQLPVEGHNFKYQIQFESNYKKQCHLESLNRSTNTTAVTMPAVDPGTQTPTYSQQIWWDLSCPWRVNCKILSCSHSERNSSGSSYENWSLTYWGNILIYVMSLWRSVGSSSTLIHLTLQPALMLKSSTPEKHHHLGWQR